MHMLKQFLLVVIVACSVSALSAPSIRANPLPAVTVKETPRGPLISVNAFDEPLENILRNIAEPCGIRITWRGENHRLKPIRANIKDLSLEQAVRQLIKAAGITNYLIRSCAMDAPRQPIAEVIIFANNIMAETAFAHPGTEPFENGSDSGGDHKPPDEPSHEYAEKIASFKNRYRWDNEETREWAIYLLGTIPEEAKAVGLDRIINELDKSVGSEGSTTVNETVFYRAIEAAAPPAIAAAMMQQVRRLSERYYNRRIHETTDSAPGRIYERKAMSMEGGR